MKNDITELETETLLPENLPKPVNTQLDSYLDSLGDGTRKYEGLETGLGQIDELIGGLSRFVLLAGMGGVGKSTLALQMALGVAEQEKIPVIFYSFEMSQRDVITMALQNKSRKLFRNDLELKGNAPDLAEDKREEIKKAVTNLRKVTDTFYIVDSKAMKPHLDLITEQVKAIKTIHQSEKVLIVIDSVQDIVPTDLNQTQAEAQTAQKIVELQLETNATILAIAQKNKAGVRDGGGYASVMGSVAFIHKPTTVIELIGGKEALQKAKDSKALTGDELQKLEESLSQDTKNPDTAYPIFLNVIKGRNSGYGGVALKYYGAYRYYEVGQERKYSNLYEAAREVY